MRRFLVPIVAVLALAASTASAQQSFDDVTVKATKVAGSVYLLEGAGGNIAASVGADGIVLVDDQFAPLAEKIRAALKKLGVTDKPVRFVINTHYHGDHTGGNAPFAQGATVIAHDNVRKRLASGGAAGNGASIHRVIEPAESAALPVITFGEDLTIHLNGETIRALHVPSGHTDGDAIVFFPASHVVHMGDDFVRYGFPFVDTESGGSVQGLVTACRKVLAELPADVKVIPGHGALATLEDVRAFVAMLEETTAAVDKALAQGKTLAQMKEEKLLEPWKKWSGDFVSTDGWLETLVASRTGLAGPAFQKH